jgi:KEOPS complex subunit Cgi121
VAIGVDQGPAGATYDDLDAFLAALRAVGEEYDVLVQAFDARYVADEAHLRAALDHAKRSMDRGENVADDLAVEVLCYAAGRRQIEEAMTMGLGEGVQSVIVLLDGNRADDAADAVRDLIDPGPTTPDEDRLTAFFDITPAERRATTADLAALVRERVALLDVEK